MSRRGFGTAINSKTLSRGPWTSWSTKAIDFRGRGVVDAADSCSCQPGRLLRFVVEAGNGPRIFLRTRPLRAGAATKLLAIVQEKGREAEKKAEDDER